MNSSIERHRHKIAGLCRQFAVRRLEVVGSARDRSSDLSQSDADFLVEFEASCELTALEQFFGLREELAALLERPVDLIEANAVRNPYVKASFDATREVVFAA